MIEGILRDHKDVYMVVKGSLDSSSKKKKGSFETTKKKGKFKAKRKKSKKQGKCFLY